jgi:hypothetical protein
MDTMKFLQRPVDVATMWMRDTVVGMSKTALPVPLIVKSDPGVGAGLPTTKVISFDGLPTPQLFLARIRT